MLWHKNQGAGGLVSPAATTGWDLSSARGFGFVDYDAFYTTNQETAPNGLFFKSDGLTAWVIGVGLDFVFEYSLSTAYDIRTMSYTGTSFDVDDWETNPQDIFFKSDGTSFYIIGTSGDDVNQFDMTTAWDITTASFNTNFSVSTQETAPRGIFFKPDGTKFYITGTASDSVHEYDMSTAWAISTASHNQSFSVSGQETNPFGIHFKDDGSKMFIVGTTGDDVNTYSLTTAWDISTASHVSADTTYIGGTFETSGNAVAIRFSSDGTKMFSIGLGVDRIVQYSLSTAWSPPSKQAFTISSKDLFDVSGQEANAYDIFFKPDGTKMYICGWQGDDVNEYDLSTAWDITTASFNQSQSVVTNPSGLFFKDDGTAMYVLGFSSDSVQQYSLTTAWDVSTATASGSAFSVSAQEASPYGLYIGNSGTKFYHTGTSSDSVHEYTLSTAYDITTASFDRSFSISTHEANPLGLFFKPDGTRMYTVGGTDDVQEFVLSTAWNISTATHNAEFTDPSDVYSTTSGLYWKPDGSKFFLVGTTPDYVTGWDVADGVQSVNFIDTYDSGGNGPAYTFNSVDIGTEASDRLVVVACHATGNTEAPDINLSSMTLNGSSMIKATALAEDTAAVDLYYLTVASGTSATIVATYPQTKRRCTIAVYTITGLGSDNPIDVNESANSDITPTLTLNIPTGAVAIYAHTSANTSNTTVTYSSATEHYDQVIGGENTTCSGATLTSAGNAHTQTATLAAAKDKTVLIGATWR